MEAATTIKTPIFDMIIGLVAVFVILDIIILLFLKGSKHEDK